MADQIKKSISAECLEHVIKGTDFRNLGERYVGKVRDGYDLGSKRLLITTDRLSCFDVILTTIPFKGQVINQLAQFWFEQTADIIPNHIISIPDPNVMVVKNCKVLPIEVVVRGYLAGSAWKDYKAGKKVSGIEIKLGLNEYQKLDYPILTPSTKAAQGEHDQPISTDEIVSRKIVAADLWNEVEEKAFALFKRGTEIANKNGLILCDTKYEFGLLEDKLILVDEVHTLDCARYWEADSYQNRVSSGKAPVMLDKQTVRDWLLSKGYSGEGVPPKFSNEHRLSIAVEYIHSYERVTGKVFEPVMGGVERIEANLKKALTS
jgi:phosphoribosylaminoimidazole-succinocarboxamide synthase